MNTCEEDIDENYVKNNKNYCDYENSVTLTEEINYTILHKLITNSNLEQDDLIELSSYLKNYENANNYIPKVNVSYVQKLDKNGNPIGRRYPQNSFKCLTTMKRNLRNMLIKNIYQDIDIENCSPTILHNICNINNINNPILEQYINNRKNILLDLKNRLSLENESMSKQFIIELTNGGTNTKDDLFLENYKKEIKDIINKLKQIDNYKVYLNYVNHLQENIDGKFISCLIYDYENKILMEAYKYFISNNFDVGTLEYDGLKVKKNNSDGRKVKQSDLNKINTIIKKQFNFNINFVEKKLVIDNKYTEVLNNLKPYYIIHDDVQGRNIMQSLYNDKFVCTQANTYFMNINNIWEEKKDKEVISSLVTFINNQNIRKITKIVKDDETGEITDIKTKSYSKESAGSKALAGLWLNSLSHNCYRNRNFNELMYNSTIGKLCFEDGVYDFKKRTFIPWNNCKNVYSKYKINEKFKDIQQIDNKYIINVKKKIIQACLKDELVDHFLHRLSRSLAGFITDKKWCVLLGFRNSGKGVIIEMLKESFGNDYIKNMNSGNLSVKSSNGDTAKLQSWMCDLEFARIVYSNEVSVEKNKLDGNTIKLIASGGDSVTARRNHENERTFKTQYTYYLCCNDLPDIVPADANQTRELYDFPWQFKNRNEINENDKLKCRCKKKKCNCNNSQWKNNYKIADDEIKSEFCRSKYNKLAFIKLILDSFVDEMPYNKTINDDNLMYQNEDSNDGEELVLEHFIINTSNNNFKLSEKELENEINIMKEIHQSKLKITKAKIVKILVQHGAKRYITDIYKGYQYVKLTSKSKGLSKKINNKDDSSDNYSSSSSSSSDSD